MPPGKIFVRVFIPPNQDFAVDRIFYYCASFRCIKKVDSSNLVTPSKETPFTVAGSAILTEEDKNVLRSRGFKLAA